MAPLTRNRATKNDKVERTWVPNDLSVARRNFATF